jgi:ferredoxin-type protein NapG
VKRREFLGLGARKVTRLASRLAVGPATARPGNWLRPPFARDEPRFLLACTRCSVCLDACEFDVLFELSARLGRQVAGTPAMDLLKRGCRMCSDWPCVAACEPGALSRPDGATAPAAPLARLSIDTHTCLPYAGPECGACADACPVPGALNWPDGIRPTIDAARCTGCALCREACIVDPKAITVEAVPDHERTAPVS